MTSNIVRPPAAHAQPGNPPCIVLGVETQIGLGIVRELGRAGVRVVGIAHDAGALGLASRYLWRSVVVPAPRSDALLGTLRSLGEELGPCGLLTVSEANLQWLATHSAELGQVHAAVPASEQLAVVLDKQRTLALARDVGIAVPQSVEPGSLTEALALAATFRFPAVVKWKDPNAVAPKLRACGLPLLKAEYVYTGDEWAAVARRYMPLGQWPLVQQYVPGRGLGQFFFMHEGRAVRRFQHVRVAEWPPEGGFSSICDAVPLDRHLALQEQSIELLRRIGWEGVAMVEYRWDEATDTAVLMEINGRFWGSFPLAVHCHAGFALLAYRAAMQQPLPDLPPPRQDLRCRLMSAEVKRLGRLLFAPQRIADRAFHVRPWHELAGFIANFVRPRVHYYVWASDDPAPFFADMRNVLGRRR